MKEDEVHEVESSFKPAMTEFKGHPDQKFGHLTYSQHGEDLVFLNLCKLLKLDKPTYLDLGAYHPIVISNTALLYKNGVRGVNIEANALLIDEFLKERPEDLTVCMGVAPISGRMAFYMESDYSVLNSLKEDSFAQHGTTFKKSSLIQVMTINEIVEKYCNNQFPDFLMTDLEDMDYDVLSSADFTHSKPKVICSEIRSDQSLETRKMLIKKGFTFLCRMGSNCIFVDNCLYRYCV